MISKFSIFLFSLIVWTGAFARDLRGYTQETYNKIFQETPNIEKQDVYEVRKKQIFELCPMFESELHFFSRNLVNDFKKGDLAIEQLVELTFLIDRQQKPSRVAFETLLSLAEVVRSDRILADQVLVKAKNRVHELRSATYYADLQQYYYTERLVRGESHPKPVDFKARQTTPPGIYKVGSTYHGNQHVFGTGTAVQIRSNGKIVVLTAAHLVGGAAPSLFLGGKQVPLKLLVVDNTEDVALLESGQSLPAVAAVFGEDQKLRLSEDMMDLNSKGHLPFVNVGDFYTKSSLERAYLGFLLPDWAGPGVDGKTSHRVDHAGRDEFVASTKVTPDHRTSAFPVKVTGGVSGALIFDEFSGLFHGVIVESHLFFAETMSTSFKPVLDLFQRLQAGRLGFVTSARWIVRNGALFRELEPGVFDINFGSQPTGNGTTAPPGNGTTAPPGNSSKDVFDQWNSRPSIFNKHFQLAPGLSIHGQTILGYRVVSDGDQKTYPQNFTTVADAKSFHFLRENGAVFKGTAITDATHLVGLVWERYGVDRKKEMVVHATRGPRIVDAKGTRFESSLNKIVLRPQEITVQIQVPRDKTEWSWTYENLEFTLEKNGALRGQKNFQPLVEVRGASGDLYIVDLQRLFFGDLSQLRVPVPGSTDDQGESSNLSALIRDQLFSPRIDVKNTRTGFEARYTF